MIQAHVQVCACAEPLYGVHFSEEIKLFRRRVGALEVRFYFNMERVSGVIEYSLKVLEIIQLNSNL